MQTTIDVKGMTCAHCEKSVKNALEGLVGVSAVAVHLDSGKVDVTYDEAKVDIAEISETVEDQGYDVL